MVLTSCSMHLQPEMGWNSSSTASLKLLEWLAIKTEKICHLIQNRQLKHVAEVLTSCSIHFSTKRCWNSSSTASLKLLDASAVETLKIRFFFQITIGSKHQIIVLTWFPCIHQQMSAGTACQLLHWSCWRDRQ